MLGFKTFAESPIASLVVLNDVNVTPTGQVGTGAVGSLGFSLDLNFSVNMLLLFIFCQIYNKPNVFVYCNFNK